jgi:hypothetical protein
MNAFIATSRPSVFIPATYSCLAAVLAALLTAAMPFAVRGQSDDFNDRNDNGWTRYSPFTPFGAPAQFFFTNGGYRIRAALSPNPSQLGPPRAGSFREDIIYTNFYIAVDIVNWDDTVRQAFGLLARVNNPGLGTTIGYAFTYDRGSGVTMTSGDTDLSAIICQPGVSCEIPTGIVTGPSAIHLDPTKDYRFVFIGQGPNLEGRIYELPNTSTPVLGIMGVDSRYESGYGGLVVYDNTGSAPDIQPDVTFDNYFATDVEPPRLTLTDLSFGDIKMSWPSPSTGFRLQASPVLPAAPWTDIFENEIFDDGQTRAYFTSTTTGNRFFRLAKP